MSNLIEPSVREAIATAQGSLTAAAKLLHIRRNELMEFVARQPDVREFVLNVRAELADKCQTALGAAIDAGTPWAIKYTLKKFGADRGYKLQEQEGSTDSAPVLFREQESLVDRAETALRVAVKKKKPWAILYTLNTLGRSRGFGL
jgi:hypothetical protein